MFAAYDVDVVFERPSFSIEFESVDAFETVMLDNSSGFDDLRRALDDIGCWEQAHSDFGRAVENANEANDGSCRLTWDCLLIMAPTPVARDVPPLVGLPGWCTTGRSHQRSGRSSPN